MVTVLFILLICYVSLFNDLLPKTNFGSGIPDLDSFRIVSYLLLLASMLHWSIKKDIRIISRWLIILAVFYLFIFASVTWSVNSYSREIIRDLLDNTFIPFFIVLVAYNLFQNEDNAKKYTRHITVAALILSLVSILQMVLAIMQGSTEFRTTGTFTNPNELAIILVLTIPCLLYGKDIRIFPRVFEWIVMFSVVAGIISTVSRKGTITMMICFCLYSLLKKRYRSFIVTLIAFTLITAGIFSIPIIAQRYEQERFSMAFEEKWDYSLAGLKMFQENPTIGLGYEGYKDHFNKYLPFHKRKRFDAHNIFITALANYGLLGFTLFLYLFFHPLLFSFKAWLRHSNTEKHQYSTHMAIICILSIIPFMISGWFAGGLFYKPIVVSLLYSNIALSLAVNE